MSKFTLKRYSSVEEIQISIYDGHLTIDEIVDSEFTGFDLSGKEVIIPMSEQIACIKKQGVWGYVDKKCTIHYWVSETVEIKDIIHFLAHEIGHKTGTKYRNELKEELKAESFGEVAELAYILSCQIK